MEIFDAIRQEYGQQIFPCWQLSAILKDCGYTEKEISNVVRKAIDQKRIGIISFRKVKRKPSSEKLLVII